MTYSSVLSTCVFAASIGSVGWMIGVLMQQGRLASNAADTNEAWYFACGFTVALVASVAANVWVAAAWVHAGVMGLGAVAVLCALACSPPPRRKVFLTVLLGAVCCVGISSFFWNWIFYGNDFWLASGTNHDLLYFFIGAQWADQHPVLATQHTVQANLRLGTCQAALVGAGCPVYRGGAYSWIALANAFLQPFTPTNARASIGFVAMCAYIALIPTTISSFTRPATYIVRQVVITLVAALIISFSTGVLGAAFNENVGTALVAGPLVMIVCLANVRCANPLSKAILLGLCAGLAGHLYGEGVVYACAMAAAAIVSDSVRLRRPRWIFTGGLIAIVSTVLTLNVVLVELKHSFDAIRATVDAAGSWEAWYLDRSPAAWLAAPFAGLLMSASQSVSSFAFVAGLALTAATVAFGLKSGDRLVLLGLLALSGSLVVYITRADYAYGEHKIIQILAPMWSAYLFASLLSRKERWSKSRRVFAASISGLAVSVSADFIVRADVLVSRNLTGVSLSSDFDDGFVNIRAGDEILIDPYLATEGHRIYRLDYATAVAVGRGARVRLPAHVEPRSVGHTQRALANTVASAATPDWLLQLKGTRPASVLAYDEHAKVFDGSAYRLYRLSASSVPVVLPGKGFEQCSAASCALAQPMELEVFSRAGCVRPSLTVEFAGGSAGAILVQGGTPMPSLDPASKARIDVSLQPGWTHVRLKAEAADAKRIRLTRISPSC